MIFINSQGDYSANSIGHVDITRLVNTVTIEGEETIVGMQAQLVARANYSDGTTAVVSPSWSIQDGSNYASISNSGVLTILEGASLASVVVQAVYGTKVATKTFTVTYKYDVTFEIQVGDTTQYNGVAKSIYVYGNIGNDSYAYSFILPCKSGYKIDIDADPLTYNESEYTAYPYMVAGYNLNEFEDGTNNSNARINKVATTTYYSGYTSKIAQDPITLPLAFPKQYNSGGTAITDDIPYVGITMKWKNSSNDSYSVAYWTTGLQGKKIRVRIYED